MNINATGARSEWWVNFLVRAVTKWRPKALESGNHALVALGDCATETRDKAELEGVLRLYLDEYLGGLPDFSRDDE
jgi:hypothetical protein